jgi:hypothetical protein
MAQDPASTDTPPVDPEHVSEGLQRPALDIPPLPPAADTPRFKTSTEGQWPVETPLQVIRRELAEAHTSRPAPVAGITPPLVSVDVLPAILSAIQKVKDARHAHAEADARQMVDEDLQAFCAVHDCDQQPGSASEGVIVAH